MRCTKLSMYVSFLPTLLLALFRRSSISLLHRCIGGKEGSDSIITEFGPEASGKDWKFDENTPYAEVSCRGIHQSSSAVTLTCVLPLSCVYRQLWMTTHPNLPSKLYNNPSKLLSKHLDEHPELLGAVPGKFPKPVEGKNDKHVPFVFKILTCKQGPPISLSFYILCES
jgi:hypothetical protein